jgi:hypothetical protein
VRDATGHDEHVMGAELATQGVLERARVVGGVLEVDLGNVVLAKRRAQRVRIRVADLMVLDRPARWHELVARRYHRDLGARDAFGPTPPPRRPQSRELRAGFRP